MCDDDRPRCGRCREGEFVFVRERELEVGILLLRLPLYSLLVLIIK